MNKINVQKKLNLFICENYFPEFQYVVKSHNFDDVNIYSYPSLCVNRNKREKAIQLISDVCNRGEETIFICNDNCEILKLVPVGSKIFSTASKFCYHYLANDSFLEYIYGKGGYVIGLGWLNNWQERLAEAGFDESTARPFYKEFCKELVFFDAGIDNEAQAKLKDLSKYLDLPFVVISYNTVEITQMIKSIVYEWRLQNSIEENKKTIASAQAKSAEHSTILDMMGKIATFTNKRETIGKIKEIFQVVFGAKRFKFIEKDAIKGEKNDLISDLIADNKKSYMLFKEEKSFLIKVEQNNNMFAIIEAGDFLFPQYINDYLNFAIEIARISGLVLSNIEQYEKLINSEKNLQYLNYHDPLTGLFNRAYINEIIATQNYNKSIAVFGLDIDRLKYVNDNFGHREGDRLIINVSEILKESFRDSDTIARIGGDEFVVILFSCDKSLAEMFGERITKEIDNFNSKNKFPQLEVSISFGYAVLENEDDTLEILIHKADDIMYKNKAEKKRRLGQ